MNEETTEKRKKCNNNWRNGRANKVWKKAKKSWNGEKMLPRGACAELIALRSILVDVTFWTAVCAMRTRHVHNKWYLVPSSYLVLLLYAQKNAQRRTTQHRKTKGKTRHRTMLRCTAELYIAGLTGAGCALWSHNVLCTNLLIVPVRGMILRMNVTGVYELIKVPQSTQHGKAAKHVEAQRCAPLSWSCRASQGTARRCVAASYSTAVRRCGADEPPEMPGMHQPGAAQRYFSSATNFLEELRDGSFPQQLIFFSAITGWEGLRGGSICRARSPRGSRTK